MVSLLPDPRRDAGAVLSAALRLRRAEVHALGCALAPEGPGPGVRFGDYADGSEAPAKLTAYSQRFSAPEEFFALVEEGDPGALVFGFELAARLDPEVALPAARLLLPRAPWPLLGQALGHALGACHSEESFRLLLDHRDVPFLREGLASSRYAGGVPEVVAALDEVALHEPALDPRVRAQALPLLSYLQRHDPDAAFARLVALVDVDGEVSVYASHSLAARDDGRALLVARLRAVPPGAPLAYAERLAVRVLLEVDAPRALDALGGGEFLQSEPGRPRLRALLDWLRADAFRRPTEPSQGWLNADPRFPPLLTSLARDPDRAVASLARDLRAKLPASAPPGGRRSARGATPGAPTVPAASPSDALVAEVTSMRDALARLVAHLRATGYRFASPRSALVAPRAKDLAALAKLEKVALVPPSLALVWRTLGGIDLRGEHPSWVKPAYLGFRGNSEPVWLTDPLVIAPAADAIQSALDEGVAPPLVLPLAPDALAKAGYSGASFDLELPGLDTGPHGVAPLDAALLEHMRRALAWAGFPGFARLDDAPGPWLAAARRALAQS